MISLLMPPPSLWIAMIAILLVGGVALGVVVLMIVFKGFSLLMPELDAQLEQDAIDRGRQ